MNGSSNGDGVFADFDDAANIEDPRKFDFGAVFQGLLRTGTDLGRAYLAPKPQPQQIPVPPPQPKQPAWLIPALIGGGVLVLLVFAGVLFSGRR